MQESSIFFFLRGHPLEDVPDALGATVRRLRGAARLTQARLARRAGLSRASVCRIEAGRRPGRVDTVFRLAAGLRVPVDDLVPAWMPDGADHRHYGDLVRERRRAARMTLDQLAARIGVSGATLSRFERGERASGRLLAVLDGRFVLVSAPLREFVGLPALRR